MYVRVQKGDFMFDALRHYNFGSNVVFETLEISSVRPVVSFVTVVVLCPSVLVRPVVVVRPLSVRPRGRPSIFLPPLMTT